ncbi:MAG TPA: FliH/SctL family protein [Telluria sp.]|nr:FliH/SctL family protein [Telluria sp.]
MGAIIRAAPVSAVARTLRRLDERPSAPALAAVASLASMTAAAHAPAPLPDETQSPSSGAVTLNAEAEQTAAAAREEAHAAELAQQRQAARDELAAALADAERRGFAVGEQKGETAAREDLQYQVDRVKTLANQLVHARAKVLEDAEDGMVEIAFAAVCRLLGDEGSTREAMLRMVRHAAAGVREREQLTIRLHPADVLLLELGAHGPEAELSLRADADVALGGCIVDSSSGALDARLETQLAQLAESLLAVRAQRRVGAEAA